VSCAFPSGVDVLLFFTLRVSGRTKIQSSPDGKKNGVTHFDRCGEVAATSIAFPYSPQALPNHKKCEVVFRSPAALYVSSNKLDFPSLTSFPSSLDPAPSSFLLLDLVSTIPALRYSRHLSVLNFVFSADVPAPGPTSEGASSFIFSFPGQPLRPWFRP